MKKLLTVLFSLLLVAVLLPAVLHTADAATVSGTCGDNLTWSLDSETGVLKIEGTGEMTWDGWDPPWDSYDSYIKTVSIGSGVTSIGDRAFEECTDLTSVTIPDSVTSIDDEAFEECTGLTSVTIPDSVTSIGYRAFSWCKGLTSITIPDSVTSIGDEAFLCCTNLQSLTIPFSVNFYRYDYSRGEGPQYFIVFEGCESINYIHFTKGEGTFSSSVSHANRKCFPWFISQENNLVVVLDDGIDRIEDHLFDGCTGLINITIPDSVTSIGIDAFYGCTGLTSVTIPDSVTSIGFDAFYGCTGLTSVTFGNGWTTICNDAFNKCTGLTSITIPYGVIRINSNTFSGCSALKDIWYGGTRRDRENTLMVLYDYLDPYPLLKAKWHYRFDGTIEWNAEDLKFKGETPYVISDGTAKAPRFTVKDADGNTVSAYNYDYEYVENTAAGTGYLNITFKGDYYGTVQKFFKIYLPATTATTVENAEDGIHLTWKAVDGAAGYVIYRRAWNLKSAGWTDFVRWNNTKDLEWTDTKVYAGTRYQYGIKAYFERRTDPVSGVEIGGNVGDNFNLGMVGPLKTTVRITTRKLTSVKAGTKKMTVKWEGSKIFTGYEIQYALNSAFTKSLKTVKIKDATTVKKVIKKLKTGKKYYVRVRSYHVFEGMTYYGQWSNVKNCTVK